MFSGHADQLLLLSCWDVCDWHCDVYLSVPCVCLHLPIANGRSCVTKYPSMISLRLTGAVCLRMKEMSTHVAEHVGLLYSGMQRTNCKHLCDVSCFGVRTVSPLPHILPQSRSPGYSTPGTHSPLSGQISHFLIHVKFTGRKCVVWFMSFA